MRRRARAERHGKARLRHSRGGAPLTVLPHQSSQRSLTHTPTHVFVRWWRGEGGRRKPARLKLTARLALSSSGRQTRTHPCQARVTPCSTPTLHLLLPPPPPIAARGDFNGGASRTGRNTTTINNHLLSVRRAPLSISPPPHPSGTRQRQQ